EDTIPAFVRLHGALADHLLNGPLALGHDLVGIRSIDDLVAVPIVFAPLEPKRPAVRVELSPLLQGSVVVDGILCHPVLQPAHPFNAWQGFRPVSAVFLRNNVAAIRAPGRSDVETTFIRRWPPFGHFLSKTKAPSCQTKQCSKQDRKYSAHLSTLL